MRTYYHGTKSNVNDVINNPMMKPSANGFGLYLTESIQAASSYGEVIAFEVPDDFEFDCIRGMDWMPWGCHEFIINTQATWVEFMKSLEDVHLESYATPF